MKNLTKRIAAAAIAFTLIGTGTTLPKTFESQTNTSITTYAACDHKNPRFSSYGEWETYDEVYKTQRYFLVILVKKVVQKKQKRLVTVKCSKCDKSLRSYYQYRTIDV